MTSIPFARRRAAQNGDTTAASSSAAAAPAVHFRLRLNAPPRKGRAGREGELDRYADFLYRLVEVNQITADRAATYFSQYRLARARAEA